MSLAHLHLNWLAVLTSGVVIFLLGGLWYSRVLFAKPWIALMGKTEEELKGGAEGSPMALLLAMALGCGLLISFVMAVLLRHFEPLTPLRGALVGLGCWIGFAAPTSFATSAFSMTPKRLWLINSGYNLVAFVLAALILTVWK